VTASSRSRCTLPDVYVPCDSAKASANNRRLSRSAIAARTFTKRWNDVRNALRFSRTYGRGRQASDLTDVGLRMCVSGRTRHPVGAKPQRVKLARELAKRATGKDAVLLDEPDGPDCTFTTWRSCSTFSIGCATRAIRSWSSSTSGRHQDGRLGHRHGAGKGESGGRCGSRDPGRYCRDRGSYTGEFLRPLLERTTARRSATGAG